MQRFTAWLDKGEYTAHGEVFDVGIATRKALQRFKQGTDPLECGGTSENDNGNGSLMRIFPIIFCLSQFGALLVSDYAPCYIAESECVTIAHRISSLTHAHKRSRMACGIYYAVAIQLWKSKYEKTLNSAINYGLQAAKARYKTGVYNEKFVKIDRESGRAKYTTEKYTEELKHYKRLFRRDFAKLPEEEIKSTGYVVDTLEAALWCLLNTDNYKDCVLKAVNLGCDTDTVAAVAGGLAGIFYGVDGIPKEWLEKLARRDYIEKLCEDFYRSLHSYKGVE